MAKNVKQQFGHKNPIFVHEERTLIAAVDRADESSSNSQTIGRNGEVALLDLLNRYLPHTMAVRRGHFVAPNGDLSPETDLMLLDTRYPLIAHNDDGSVLAMLHSVVAAIEVKRTLNKSEIQKILHNSSITTSLQSGAFGAAMEWGIVLQKAFAYRASIKTCTIQKHFFAERESDPSRTHLSVLRILPSDFPDPERTYGAHLWLEDHNAPSHVTTVSPLSDFYYNLVQDAYYTMGARAYDMDDVAENMNQYMNWGTHPNALSEDEG